MAVNCSGGKDRGSYNVLLILESNSLTRDVCILFARVQDAVIGDMNSSMHNCITLHSAMLANIVSGLKCKCLMLLHTSELLQC